MVNGVWVPVDINTTNKDERESFIELIKFIDL